MKNFDNYTCEGQMNIFDFLDDKEPETESEVQQQKKNTWWHEVPSVMPENKDWEKALFVIYNRKTDEIYYNVPGEVKDKTFRRSAGTPEGEVMAWRYVDEKFERDV